jgi:hypothetical protein
MGSDKRRQAAGSRRCHILQDAPKFAQIDIRAAFQAATAQSANPETR